MALKVRSEENFERGMETGMERERLKNALAMKEDGVDAQAIAKWTGLPVDVIFGL
jgi:hypothetical protein